MSSISSSVLTVAAVLTMLAAIAAAADPPAAPAASTPPLPEVSIMGRLRLERRLLSFVYGVTDLANGEGVARWNQPVCPLVAGLSRQDGEFILARISDAARAAQVPLAGERCQPNLDILVSSDPQGELKRLHSHASMVLFGTAPPAEIDNFLQRPGPVKVWYKSSGSAFGMPVGGRSLDAPIPQLEAPFVQGPPGGSHLRVSVVYGLGQVIMVVDQQRLSGLSRQQLADYLSMVGLAQIKPEAHLGGADTILKLFDSAPAAAPAGMSRWDQAFLKALYASDQENKMQRGEMAHIMVRELVAEPAAPPPQTGTAKP